MMRVDGLTLMLKLEALIGHSGLCIYRLYVQEDMNVAGDIQGLGVIGVGYDQDTSHMGTKVSIINYDYSLEKRMEKKCCFCLWPLPYLWQVQAMSWLLHADSIIGLFVCVCAQYSMKAF